MDEDTRKLMQISLIVFVDIALWIGLIWAVTSFAAWW